MSNAPKDQSVVSAVQIWAKGYRSSEDSEEFQRYIPQQRDQLSVLEARIAGLSWGRILEPLYGLADRELSSQRCLLLEASELMAVSFSRTEDRHNRPSIVLVTASSPIHWDDTGLGDIAARTAALALRLSGSYALSLKGNPEFVGLQLRSNEFLPVRAFALADEAPDVAVEWVQVLRAVRQWRGIRGVSTPRLLSLGANVLLGTKFEAERAQGQQVVDGFYDVRERDIKPLSSRFVKWEQPQPAPPPLLPPTNAEVPALPVDVRPLAESLDRIERRLGQIQDILHEVSNYIFRGKRRK